MSEVLVDFARPYIDAAKTKQEFERIIGIAALAWNVSFHTEETPEELASRLAADLNLPDNEGLKTALAEMIIRRRIWFAHHDRVIIKYQVTDTGRNYHVTVISTLPGQLASGNTTE